MVAREPEHIRAVIFDVGGVIVASPFDAWAEYERELGIEVGSIRGVVAATGDGGAWARHERGELTFSEFLEAFQAECTAAGCREVDAAEVMVRLTARPEPRAEMVTAVARIRESGRRTAALTNNWIVPEGDDRRMDALAHLFDVVVESAVEGLRKPDPRVYRLTCRRLGVEPHQAAFLDDLGVNLKPAREMGMTTIKVVEPHRALDELSALLGLELAPMHPADDR